MSEHNVYVTGGPGAGDLVIYLVVAVVLVATAIAWIRKLRGE